MNEFTHLELSEKSEVTNLRFDKFIKPLSEKHCTSDVVLVHGKVMSCCEDTIKFYVRCSKCESKDVFKTKR